MRDWTLGPSDPLALTLAADFRLSSTDYVNDQIWELETGGGDPPALACKPPTACARAMRLFPRFTIGNKMVTDPATFTEPVRLHRFYPNFLHLDFSPFPDIDVNAEYWVPDSHATPDALRSPISLTKSSRYSWNCADNWLHWMDNASRRF